MDYALKLQKVCKQYNGSDFTLDKITFALPTDTVMGFVGKTA
jgi:ABC superfamily ATP binding cassette transporter, ABC protein